MNEKIGKLKLSSGEIDINTPACEPEKGKCRSNCRKNPNCFSQLGEKFWFNVIKEGYWYKTNLAFQKRDKDQHVGLKNLGATCYVNTYLQLWFHNRAFRSFVYGWKSHSQVLTVETDNDEQNTYPKSISLEFSSSTDAIFGNLQYLFALLQYSEKRFVDPSSFVRSLGLHTNEQQDAQEFSKLFISLLSDALSTQNSSVPSIIDTQFGGTYSYQTKCNSCGCISENPARFYELDLNIKGHVKLKECLKEFLKEEVLDGDNKYFCSNCQCKQDATRKIVLKKLPPVLNLQLLRFIFERQTGTKKKINSTIFFPDTIDMNEFMKFNNPDDGIYHLNAVLIHRGLSAHSGHYIAHIFNKEKDVWCRFNDEEVATMKGQTLQLGKEEDLEGLPEEKPKKPKKVKGEHGSKNAYMLVYCRKNSEKNLKEIEVPEEMLECVVKDNSLCDEWYSKILTEKREAIKKGQEKQTKVLMIYSCLSVKEENEDYEWISTDWLRKWLNPEHDPTAPIDNTNLMCRHSCADPLKLTSMKRVRTEAAQALFSEYGGLPRLKSDALCTQCLDFIKKKEEFEKKLAEDMKIFSKLTKATYKPPKDGYWVGKKSLKRIKQLAVEEFHREENVNGRTLNENSISQLPSENNISTSQSPSESNTSNNQSPSENNVSTNQSSLENNEDQNNNENSINGSCNRDDDNADRLATPTFTRNKIVKFNEDLLCSKHGGLSLNVKARMIVPRDTWLRIKSYFPLCTPFNSNEETCLLCQSEARTNQEEKETKKLIANEQKQLLSLFNDVTQQKFKDQLHQTQGEITLHVVLESFVQKLKKSLRSNRVRLLNSMDNSEVMCTHGFLLYTPEEIIDAASISNPEIYLLTSEEYGMLSSYFTTDNQISITITHKNEESSTYISKPNYCRECRNIRLVEEAHESRQYTSAIIFIMKKFNTKTDFSGSPSVAPGVLEQNDNLAMSPVTSTDEIDEQKENSAGNNNSIGEKRDSDTFYPKALKKFKKSQTDGDRRRSSRHRTKRGEYSVKVDSNQTLKELKIQLLHLFSVLPVEQTLMFEDGTKIENNDKCLEELGIKPGAHLTLVVDEPCAERTVFDESTPGKPRALEEGFKGTNLYGNSSQSV